MRFGVVIWLGAGRGESMVCGVESWVFWCVPVLRRMESGIAVCSVV